MTTNTQLRAGHVQIGNMLFKITWETERSSYSMDPKIVECALVPTNRGRPWDMDTMKVADRLAELAKSMKSSLNQEVPNEVE